ncbi:MAG TPA: MFS transporter [Micromonosporaceae bacterium]
MGLWRDRDFRLWWTGNLTSAVGTAMTMIALPLLVLAITGSPGQAGGVGALEAVPYAVLSLPVGTIVDRYQRRALLVAAALVSAVSMASIPVTYAFGHLTIAQIYAVALVNGAAGVVTEVTQVAALPRLVAEDQLGTAAGQAEVIYNLSAIVGPPLAGLLLVHAWPVLPFAVDALSFAIAALSILAIRRALSGESAGRPSSWRSDLTLGAGTVRRNRRLRAMTILTIAGDLLFAGITILMTVLVRSRGGSPEEVGTVFAMAAIGGVIGSLLASRVERRIGVVASIVIRSWATAVLFPLLALDVPVLLLGVVWAAVTVSIAMMNVVQMSFLVTTIPSERLGRVQGFMTLLAYGVLPVGTLLIGGSLELFGATHTVLLMSAVLAVLAVYSSFSRDLRTVPEPQPL